MKQRFRYRCIKETAEKKDCDVEKKKRRLGLDKYKARNLRRQET